MKRQCKMVSCIHCNKEMKGHLADYTLSVSDSGNQRKWEWVPICFGCKYAISEVVKNPGKA